jgi:hypothetical protein
MQAVFPPSAPQEPGGTCFDYALLLLLQVATLFDEDGIEVRFINADAQGNGIK